MKTIGVVLVIVVAISAFLLLSNRSDNRPEFMATAESIPAEQLTLPVEGMTCGACAVSVKMALNKLDGIRRAKVDVENGEAVITYTEGKVTLEQMIQAINSTGFTARKPSAG